MKVNGIDIKTEADVSKRPTITLLDLRIQLRKAFRLIDNELQKRQRDGNVKTQTEENK